MSSSSSASSGVPNSTFYSGSQSSLKSLLTEREVARLTAMSVASVRRWRLLRKGPVYVKIGSAVRYRPEDISTWLHSCPSGGEVANRESTKLSATSEFVKGGR